MFNYELLNSLYTKKIFPQSITDEELIIILFYLSQDINLSKLLIQCFSHLFLIKPIHLYAELYYNIPKSYKIPFFKKIEQYNLTEDKVLTEIAKILNWSEREIQLNKPFLNKVELRKGLGLE